MCVTFGSGKNFARLAVGCRWRSFDHPRVPSFQQTSHVHDKSYYIFMWQTDLVAVAKFLDECLELVYTAGPLDAGKASNKP